MEISKRSGIRWQDLAACRGEWDLFDEIDGTDKEYKDAELAQLICSSCPVFDYCKVAGKGQSGGIWAGEVK